MVDLVWYRSIYWRIALGFVALVATLLVLQILVFLWISGRMDDLFPNRTPAQFAGTIATDLSAELGEQPTLDVDAFVNSRYSGASRGFAVVLSDGRAVVSHRVPPPPMLARIARSRLFDDPYTDRRSGGRFRGRGPDGDDRPEFGPGRSGGPGGPRGLAVEFAFINVNGTVAGIVAVPVEPPPLSLTLRDLGPTLAIVALGLLTVGTTVAALAIFRPARRRLSELQDAARAIGAGEVGVRAPVTGGDEVSLLAHSFNEMASELEQRTQALERSDRARRQLLADVSHELSTPLAAIRGYVETLSMAEVPLTENTRRRYLHIVTDETERLEHIVGDLLELARLEGGGGSWREDDVSISQLLERVRHRHEPRIREKNVTLSTEREASAETIAGDPNRLEQALQNLVANAIRHTPSGGTVTVRAASRGDRIVLSVEDTGPGISSEHLPRIFDRFYKVDESRASTDTSSGSGLGLSIVRAIVTRHGGTVTASNVQGGGARFEIVLPVRR
jgi:two-component system OmpR family sensor kinase